VGELARRAGWELRHKMLPEEQKVEIEKVDEATYTVKARN